MEDEELKTPITPKEPVTFRNATVGDKVIKGPHWNYKVNQDGKNSDPLKNTGTITKIFTESEKQFIPFGDVQVLWDWENALGYEPHLAYRANDEFQDLYHVEYDAMTKLMSKLDGMIGSEPEVDEITKMLEALENKMS